MVEEAGIYRWRIKLGEMYKTKDFIEVYKPYENQAIQIQYHVEPDWPEEQKYMIFATCYRPYGCQGSVTLYAYEIRGKEIDISKQVSAFFPYGPIYLKVIDINADYVTLELALEWPTLRASYVRYGSMSYALTPVNAIKETTEPKISWSATVTPTQAKPGQTVTVYVVAKSDSNVTIKATFKLFGQEKSVTRTAYGGTPVTLSAKFIAPTTPGTYQGTVTLYAYY